MRPLWQLTFLLLASLLLHTGVGDSQTEGRQSRKAKARARAAQEAASGTGSSPETLRANFRHTTNLDCILERQQLLEQECQIYQEAKEAELKQILRLNADPRHPLALRSPLRVKLPAVCLYLLASPLGEEPTGSGESSVSKRLELVNWPYEFDDGGPASKAADSSRLRKRAAGSGSVTAEESLPEVAGSTPLLDELILDQTAAGYAANEIDTNERLKFRQDVERLIHMSNFHEAVNKSRSQVDEHLSPVILIPGLLGSRLQARTDKDYRVNLFCRKQSSWQEMWLSVRQLLPFVVDCWLDNVRLVYNPLTKFTKVPSGVQSRVPDFGSVESVRHLDLNQPKVSEYFGPLIERYEQLGYTADENLLAAPYDFRLAPQELPGWMSDLERLIEASYERANGKKKATLVCHSMGCTHALIFLRQVSSTWREKHVRKLVALSSPWGGSIKALKALVVGDTLDLPLVSEMKMRKLAKTYPSIAYLLPQIEVFSLLGKGRHDADPNGPTLVETPKKSYKVSQLESLMQDLNLTLQYEWFKKTSSLIRPLEPIEGLRVDCIHGLNTPTPETLLFRRQEDFPDGQYELINGEGDGTVNYESLMVCAYWKSKFPELIRHKVIMNTNHLGVLNHKQTLDLITDDVFAPE